MAIDHAATSEYRHNRIKSIFQTKYWNFDKFIIIFSDQFLFLHVACDSILQ